uniref:C2H2-type domain-containing protein n=3 Tax=Octopus bimaculoides TaxID=37653 RepID=A0A0L8HKV6_OCTBM|eukprot:XP_014771589.1 PREDICTED: gastrula zinc finger protein XlCGF49.1-like [Octopus bimaculoides]
MEASTASVNEEPVQVKKKIIENGFYCDVCEKVFSSRAHARTHKPAHMCLRKLKCSKCEKRFYRPHHLRAHETIHSSARPFACDICKKTFKLEMTLKHHRNSHSGERPHECPDCAFRFREPKALKRHYRNIHLNQKFYECNVCKTKFNRRESLRSHLNKHKEDYPFGCNLCGKLFADASQLQKHKKASHLEIRTSKSSQSQQKT